MPDTFQALAVVAVALLPGALYTWGFERMVGNWGVSLSDRVLRFVGVSAFFQVLWAPVSVAVWRDLVVTGDAARGDLPGWTWLAAALYVGLPFSVGSLVGTGTKKRWDWAKLFTGLSPAPRAWDHLFSSEPDGWIRLRLKDGTWLGGAFTRGEAGELGSYAAGYPDPQDLYLARAVDVDPESGEFLFDGNDRVRMKGSGILIGWEQMEYLSSTTHEVTFRGETRERQQGADREEGWLRAWPEDGLRARAPSEGSGRGSEAFDGFGRKRQA